MTMERLGRVTHPSLGKCVKIACTVDRRREVWLFPIDQRLIQQHKRHPTGYDPEDINRFSCFSPSLSFYRDLVRYAQFRFGD